MFKFVTFISLVPLCLSLYVSMYLYVCVCICVYVWLRVLALVSLFVAGVGMKGLGGISTHQLGRRWLMSAGQWAHSPAASYHRHGPGLVPLRYTLTFTLTFTLSPRHPASLSACLAVVCVFVYSVCVGVNPLILKLPEQLC